MSGFTLSVSGTLRVRSGGGRAFSTCGNGTGEWTGSVPRPSQKARVETALYFKRDSGTLYLEAGIPDPSVLVTFGIPGVTYELGYAYWMAAGGAACACSAGILLIVASYFSAQGPGKDQSLQRCPAGSKGTYL